MVFETNNTLYKTHVCVIVILTENTYIDLSQIIHFTYNTEQTCVRLNDFGLELQLKDIRLFTEQICFQSSLKPSYHEINNQK